MKQFYVYIMASQKVGTLYIGVTSDLKKRVWEHKNKVADGFTSKHKVDKLVYYEVFEDAENAIIREKRMEKWEREWKINRIREINPEWDDLYEQLG